MAVPNRNVLLAVLISGAFVVILNQTLLNTALPAFIEDFQITENTAQWLTTVFMLVNAIMIPLTAMLINKFTTRTLFLTAMILFVIGTVVSGVAPGFSVLIVGRVLQAAGGGILIPLMQTILFSIFPIDKRGGAMGTFGLVIALAPAIGPSLSGWMIDNYHWRYLFFMVLPIAIAATVLSYFLLKNVNRRTDPKVDALSIMLSSLGFGGLLYGSSIAGAEGWGSPQVVIALAASAFILLWFIIRQLKLNEPMLEFRVFKYGMFTLNTALGMCVFIVMVGGMMLLPLYMQTMNGDVPGEGFSATKSGLALLPGAVVMGLMSPITGRLFDRYGARWLAVGGFTLVSGTTLLYATMDSHSSFTFVALVNVGRMFGVAMVMMPVTTAALNQLPPHLIPHGTAMNNTMRQVAGSIGTAVLITIMTTATKDPSEYGVDGMVHGSNVAFLVAGILGAFGIVGSFFIKKFDYGDRAKKLVEDEAEPVTADVAG